MRPLRPTAIALCMLTASTIAFAEDEAPSEAASPSFSAPKLFDGSGPTLSLPSALADGLASVTSIFKPRGSDTTLISELQPKPYEASSLAIGVEKDMAQKRGEGYTLVNSPDIENYLNAIRQKLTDASGVTEVPGKVKVRATTDLTASATPDGNIFIGLSSLIYAQSEDEIAAIIAHELSHILLGHFGSDTFSNLQERIGFLAETGLALKASLQNTDAFSKKDLSTLQSLQLLKEVTDTIILPSWGRKQEREADLLGIDLLVKAGYSPTAMITVHEKLEEWEIKHGQSEAEFQRLVLKQFQTDLGSAIRSIFKHALGASHPAPADRIRDSAEYIQKYHEDIDRQTNPSGWRTVANRKGVNEILTNYDKTFSAEIHLSKRDLDTAFKLAQQGASGATRNHAYPNWVLGRTAALKGNRKVATEAYARAMQAGDPPRGLYEDVILFEESARNWDRAIALANTAQSQYGDSAAWYPIRISLYRKANRKDEASRLALQCAAEAPNIRLRCMEAASDN